jgi:hypothetical protein
MRLTRSFAPRVILRTHHECGGDHSSRPKRVTGCAQAREIGEMGELGRRQKRWARALRRLVLLAFCALAMACTHAPRVSVQSALGALPDPLMHERDDAMRRVASFGGLHETARLLIIAHGAQSEWVHRGLVSLPVESCIAAVGSGGLDAVECTLIALADAQTAVLVLSQSEACDRATCLEQSWVFLDDQRSAIPLPARRAADYGSLRADLSREYAEALWLAGYRGRRDARTADASDPYAEPDPYADERPSVASYASCTRAPHGSELVCRSREGHLIGLNPLTAVERVIARLELDALSREGIAAPPFLTADGELAVVVHVERHALCGEQACTLLGVVEEGAVLRFVSLPR